MKVTKFLFYVGLASTAAYLTHVLTKKSDEHSKRTSHQKITKSSSKKNFIKHKNQRHEDTSKNAYNSSNQIMYKNLSMTDQQRQKYEKDYETLTKNWQHDNPNYDLDENQKSEYQDATLKAVLNEDQYGMYRDDYRQ